MITVSPAGSTATANELSLLVNIKEKICKPYCVGSTLVPQVSINYVTGDLVLNGETVFVPITAIMTIVTPNKNSKCNATTQLFTEKFLVAFQGQTTLPGTARVVRRGQVQGGTDIICCKATKYEYNDSILVSIIPN